MTPEQTRTLIAAAGGNKAFCIRVGLDYNLKTARRVDNWRQRGIPPRIQLDHGKQLASLARTALRKGFVL